MQSRQRLVSAASVLAALALASPAAGAQAASSEADRLVPACTPELVHSFTPGREMDARGVGTGFAANLRYTDAAGNPQPPSTATVQWSARAVVDEPDRDTGVGPNIGGDLDLVITTAAGERLTFTATCIAAAVGFRLGLIVYANGITRGWPGSQARRTLVHFEAYTDDSAYIAVVDGTDCRLNFDALVVTDEPYISGPSSFSGLPARAVFAETDCARRFGHPYPALRAPGMLEP